MNADGSGQRNLTRNALLDENPVWSPDGRKIAFVGTREHNSDVYVMNADGSGQRRLTRGMRPLFKSLERRWSSRDPLLLPGRPTGKGSPSWARPYGSWDVYVMNADGSGQRRLTQQPGGPDHDSCLVARRADDRLRQPCRPGRLRRERRRERAAERVAQHGVRRRAGVVTRRTLDRLPEHTRWQRGDLRRECRRERPREVDARPGTRWLSCLVARRAEDRLLEPGRGPGHERRRGWITADAPERDATKI